MVVVGVAYALPQILIPTSVSHQSSIIRNIPTSLIGVPSNNVYSDRDIITQLQLERWVQDRLNNNNQNRNIQDQINREIASQLQQRRLSDQIRSEQIVQTADQLRAEQLRDDLDRSDNTRRLLQQSTGSSLSNSQLRSAISGRLL